MGAGFVWPDVDQAGVKLFGEAAEMCEVMALWAIRRAHEQETVVIAFGGLVRCKCSSFQPLLRVLINGCFFKFCFLLKPVLKVAQRLGMGDILGQDTGGYERPAFIIQDDPIKHDIDEEIAAKPQIFVKRVKAVIDHADFIADVCRAHLIENLGFGFVPKFGNVGKKPDPVSSTG